jgi:hypothetical protein
MRSEHGRIDEADALVVRDQADPAAGAVECLGHAQDGGRLAGAEKAADHDVARWCHAKGNPVGIMTHGPGPAKPYSTATGRAQSQGSEGLR